MRGRAWRLARYEVPREFHRLEALPRTGSGKIDERALRRALGAGRAP